MKYCPGTILVVRIWSSDVGQYKKNLLLILSSERCWVNNQLMKYSMNSNYGTLLRIIPIKKRDRRINPSIPAYIESVINYERT